MFFCFTGACAMCNTTCYNTELSSANQPGMTTLALTRAGENEGHRGPAQTLRGPRAHGGLCGGWVCSGDTSQGRHLPKVPLCPGTHQLLLALNHSQRGLVGVAVLSARVPVSRLLREEVAFSSIEQPVLWAGRLTPDTALGSYREERGGLSIPQCSCPPLPGPAWPHLAPKEATSAPCRSLHLPQLWCPSLT